MDFAVDLNRDDHAAALELLGRAAPWSQPAGRDYFVAPVRADDHPLLSGYRRAFFVKIEPGGHVHRHTDAAAEVFETDHIVVATNKRALAWWISPQSGAERSAHLMLGHRYRVNRGFEHWAENNGGTDRVHLLIEYPKG